MHVRIFGCALIAGGIILSEPIILFLIQRNEPIALRGQAILIIFQVFAIVVGTGIVFIGHTIELFGKKLRVKKALFTFISIYFPVLLFGLAEASLFVLIERVVSLQEISRTYNFSAFKDYEIVRPVQGENSPWRQRGFRNVDGLRLYPPVNMAGMYINQEGLRTRDLSSGKPGAIKISVMGGSTVWGSNVTDEHTLPTFIEKMLNERKEGEYEVYNLGIEGHSFKHEFRMLKKFYDKVNFDMAIFFHGGNDFIEVSRNISKKNGPAEKLQPLFPKSVYEFETFRLFEGLVLRLLNFFGLQRRPNFNNPYSKKAIGKYIDSYRSIHLRTETFCNKNKIKCYYFLQPLIFSKETHQDWEKAIHKNFRLFFPGSEQAYNLILDGIVALKLRSVHDIRDTFKSLPDPVFGDQIHVNALGNKRLAEKIVSIFKAKK